MFLQKTNKLAARNFSIFGRIFGRSKEETEAKEISVELLKKEPKK